METTRMIELSRTKQKLNGILRYNALGDGQLDRLNSE